MASVFKRKGNKQWLASFKGSDGLWKTRSAGTDKAEAQRLANLWSNQATLRRTGLIDPRLDAIKAAENVPVARHLDDFRKNIEARKGNAKHAKQTHDRAARVLALSGVTSLSQICDSRISEAVKQLRQGDETSGSRHSKARRPHSKSSIIHHLRAVKMFTRWLHRNGRAHGDLLLSVKAGATVSRSERKLLRRVMTIEEFDQLIRVVSTAPESYGMAGDDRAMLYRVAANTGFRQGELRSITVKSLELTDGEPTITVLAAYSKRRRDDQQRISSGLATMLKEWVKGKPQDGPLFAMPAPTDMADMLRADALASRNQWINESAGQARAEREASDFLASPNSSGENLDFHALRHTFVTWVAAHTKNIGVLQHAARHSSITTTQKYIHASLVDETKALEMLPLAPQTPTSAEVMKATGTDPVSYENASICAQRAHKTSGEFGLRLAGTDTTDFTGQTIAPEPQNTGEHDIPREISYAFAASSPGGGTADAEDLKSFGE